MNNDSSLIYLVAGITALHFLAGIGYLLYKIGGPSKKKKEDDSQ